MENIPTSDDEESKPFDLSEYSKETDDDESDDKKEKKEKTRRNVLFGDSKSGKDSEKGDKKNSIFGDGREGIFAGLLGDKDKESEDKQPRGEAEAQEGPESAEQYVPPEVLEEFETVVDDRIEAVSSELANSSSDPTGEINADAAFLDAVDENLTEGVPPSEAIDEAEHEVIDADNSPGPDASELNVSDSPETPEAVIEPTIMEESEVEPPEPPTAPPRSATSRRSPLTGRRHASGSPPPPTGGPPTPFHPLTPIDGLPDRAGPVDRELTPDSPDVSKMNELYYRDRSRGNLLLGGAIGYMFGRRRGRKKTEAKLQPEINKKESEIDKLKGELEQSESAVRKNAVEKASSEVDSMPVESTEDRQSQQTKREKEFERTLDAEPAQLEQESVEAIAEKEEPNVGEAERLGNIETETSLMARAAERELRISAERSPRDVKTMTTPELLELADNIMLESTSLRELYELRKIDAPSMRRVVIEYMTGHNYERLLRKSLKEVKTSLDTTDDARHERKQHATEDPPQIESETRQTYEPTQNAAESLIHPQNNSVSDQQPLQEQNSLRYEDDSTQASSSVAIILGVVVGIILMVLILFFSGLV